MWCGYGCPPIVIAALSAHEAHRDIVGPCPDDLSTVPVTVTVPITTTPVPVATPIPTLEPTVAALEGPKVTVCHCPPGNPNNAHSLSIGQSAVASHLGHGDSMGPCPEAAGNPAPSNGNGNGNGNGGNNGNNGNGNGNGGNNGNGNNGNGNGKGKGKNK